MQCPSCTQEMRGMPVVSTRGTEFRWLCPVCASAEMADIELRNEAALLLKMEKAGVPPRFRAARLEDRHLHFKNSAAVSDGSKGLFIFGETGTGKTTMLAGWCAHMAVIGKRVIFVDFSDFICSLRADFKSYAQLKAQMMAYDCLFIDNFESDNVYMYDFIFNLVNSFYQNNRQVFYTAPVLPAKSPLALRIGTTTIQIELARAVEGENR